MQQVFVAGVPLPSTAFLECPELPWERVGRGKVRDLFRNGERLLLVASDRLSAFDVVLNQGVPGKGILLTRIARLGFAVAGRVCPHHLAEDEAAQLEPLLQAVPALAGRCMVGRALEIVPVECVVRGHIAGSAWKSYRETGYVQGVRLPAGLREGDALPRPLFTPTTKAAAGHDQPLTPQEAATLLGDAFYQELEAVSLAVFEAGRRWGERAGLLLADTKFEFGRDREGKLTLADEVFTPDSSRWWDAATFEPGKALPGFDKQFVRDFLASCKGWNQTAPAPDLPDAIVRGTVERYVEAWRRLEAAGVG
jgi:phosphoribosylaminoimidazole-succinocarboxamide synthase